ncbi:MAG: CDP-glycerol glycerophosphotransferase family protein [Nitrosarchaeum sp.]|nr:CDP-glycerol glycerophosphotransferase family protein [Nitrosarchaeum sp.]
MNNSEELQIIWLVYKPERIDTGKYTDKNNIVIDIHDFHNAVEAIKKYEPDIVWAAPTLNLPDFAISIAGKKLGIPVVGELVNEIFIKDNELELFKTYLTHFFESSVPTDSGKEEKKFMRRGRFFLYKLFFLLKTQKAVGWSFFKILKYFCILVKSHLTVYKNLHNPVFSCDVHFVETEKLLNTLISKGYDKEKLIVTGIPMYDSAAKQIQELEKVKQKNSKTSVLFLTHAMYEHGIWTKEQRDSLVKKVITELSKHKDKLSITVKIHPSSEQLSDYESLIHNIDNSIEIFQKGDILEYIVNSDIIITYSGASSLVYALMCKKPIIVCNFYNLKNDIFVDRKVVLACKNEKEVINSVLDAKNKEFENDQNLKEFIEDYFYRLDGKASERIAKELVRIAKSRSC